jgi:hypothetical protein
MNVKAFFLSIIHLYQKFICFFYYAQIYITTDIWKSQKNESLMGVTAHFINVEFVMIKRALALRYLEDTHTCESIREAYFKV